MAALKILATPLVLLRFRLATRAPRPAWCYPNFDCTPRVRTRPSRYSTPPAAQARSADAASEWPVAQCYADGRRARRTYARRPGPGARMPDAAPAVRRVYQPRLPKASPLFRFVTDHLLRGQTEHAPAETPPAIVPAPRLEPREVARRCAAVLWHIFAGALRARPAGHGAMQIVACTAHASVIDRILAYLRAPAPTRKVATRCGESLHRARHDDPHRHNGLTRSHRCTLHSSH